MPTIRCNECRRIACPLAWRCHCGGSLDLADLPAFDPKAINRHDFSLWRYAAMLPVAKRFSLGEGMTPLVPSAVDGMRLHAKLEHLNPTGSFKDRGSATMLNHLAEHDATHVVDNSSGNAGASIAAYASLAGMDARIFVPAATAVDSKKRLIQAFGGQIVEARDANAAAIAAADSATYASHAWSPWFVLGQMTAAWEVWEQLGSRAPDAIATPVGHGGLFLGFYRGFKALHEVQLIEQLPRMIAVQSAGVDPIVRGWERKLTRPPAIEPKASVADGILVDAPVRGAQILDALYATDGFALRVDDSAIESAQRKLWRKGLLVEKTSAVVAACLPQIQDRLPADANIVMAFTGNALKDLA